MCDCSEGEERDTAEPAVSLESLMERSRDADARMGGGLVPDNLWPIFFGVRSGSIPWGHHARMLACREAALASLRSAEVFRPRSRTPQAAFLCQ
jgi:hypothetical protein